MFSSEGGSSRASVRRADARGGPEVVLDTPVGGTLPAGATKPAAGRVVDRVGEPPAAVGVRRGSLRAPTLGAVALPPLGRWLPRVDSTVSALPLGKERGAGDGGTMSPPLGGDGTSSSDSGSGSDSLGRPWEAPPVKANRAGDGSRVPDACEAALGSPAFHMKNAAPAKPARHNTLVKSRGPVMGLDLPWE